MKVAKGALERQQQCNPEKGNGFACGLQESVQVAQVVQYLQDMAHLYVSLQWAMGSS